MQRLFGTLFVLALLASSARAAPASEQSLVALFKLSRAEAVMDTMYDNMKAMTAQMRQQMDPNNSMSPARRQHMDKASDDAMQLVRSEFSTSKLQAMFVSVYSESFSQEEVDGLVAFYASPVGQAFVSKLPQVTQKSMAYTQAQMQSLMPRLIKLMQDAAASAPP